MGPVRVGTFWEAIVLTVLDVVAGFLEEILELLDLGVQDPVNALFPDLYRRVFG